MQHDDDTVNYFKGRGAQIKPENRFRQLHYSREHPEALDESLFSQPATQLFEERPRKIINNVKSPDIGMDYSVNPYQGCEHGCIYCYARNTHPYWGFNAGLDFESRIVIKPEAAELLVQEMSKANYTVKPIMLSGNTDCYQPLERKMRLTRKILETLYRFRHPVGIITKNALILRDLDLLKPMAEMGLVRVTISITTLNEKLRRLMEPRTASGFRRLETVQALTLAGVPVNVNVAPIIPFLNSGEVPALVKAAAGAGACSVQYIMVRLNGDVALIFEDWLRKNFPDRADKVLNQIKAMHGGNLNDSRFGKRMRGEGNMAESIRQLFQVTRARYFAGRVMPPLNCALFQVPGLARQGALF